MKLLLPLAFAVAFCAAMLTGATADAARNKGLELKFKQMISRHCVKTRTADQMVVNRSARPKVSHITIYGISRTKSGWYQIEASMFGARDFVYWHPKLKRGVCGRRNFKRFMRSRRR